MEVAQGSIAAISLGLIGFVALVLVVGIYELHSLPGRVAEGRGHPQAEAIAVCSVLGLMVFPFWMVALVWAYAGSVGQPLPKDVVTADAIGEADAANDSEPDGGES